MSRKPIWLRALVAAGGLLAVPLTINLSTATVRPNDALCVGGTCCPEQKSTCYPDGCSSGWCNEENAYWRSDGKPCSAPEG